VKAIVLNRKGDRQSIEYKDFDLPKPAQDEVLVKVAVTPINPSDLIFIDGNNPTPRPMPSVIGFEGAGTVVESGGGSQADALVGKNVACRGLPDRDGTWAEFVVTKVDRCIPLMPEVSLEQGAMLLINPLTAWALMSSARQAGHKCAIQNAAGSALGKMVVRLSRQWNLPVINVVRHSKGVAALKKIGAEHVLCSADQDFQAQLKELAHQLSATVAFDAVAGDQCNIILSAMPAGSELWVYGGLSGEHCKIDPMLLIYQDKTVKGFWGPPTVYKLEKTQFDAAILEIQQNLDSTFKSDVRRVYMPAEFEQALNDYTSSMGDGKVLFGWSQGN